VAQLRRNQEKIEAAGARVVLVGMANPRETEAFCQRFQIPFPILCDPDLKLYHAYGLKKAGVLSLFSPFTALKGLSAMSQGHLMGIPEGDIKQLGGVFVIDTTGHIRQAYDTLDLTAFPDVKDILAGISG